MEKTLLTGIAALLLATGAAHADWRLHRTCTFFYSGSDESGMYSLEDALEIQKLIPDLRKCDAFWKCVEKREAGKVKHCYANDKRWR